MKEKLKSIISNKIYILLVFLVFAIAASTLSLLNSKKSFTNDNRIYTHYNNYLIFKNSFFHLIEGKDLYKVYPEEQWDLYKYTPTFAVLFSVLAYTPDWLGLNLWNIINALIILFAVYALPRLSDIQKGLVLIICLIELMTSMQNSQSNALVAGCLILVFAMLERDNPLLATFFLVFSVFVKLFGIAALVLFLFYPRKWKLALFTLVWFILFMALPLIFIDFGQYKSLLGSYLNLLSADELESTGSPVVAWLHSWFGIIIKNLPMVITGLVLLLIPYLRLKNYSNYSFRLLNLASLLIWVIIFNHKAESPTFIIAMAGISLWFVITEKTILNISLFILALIFTSLSPTDIFPDIIREDFVKPYALKGFLCILVWGKMVFDMMFLKETTYRIDPFIKS